jgi:hypothetical protein
LGKPRAALIIRARPVCALSGPCATLGGCIPEHPALDAVARRARDDGHDLRGQPLIERNEALSRVLALTQRIRSLQHVEEQDVALYRYFEELGLEGIVGKRADAPYRAEPTQAWKKMKTPAFKEIEASRLQHKRDRRTECRHLGRNVGTSPGAKRVTDRESSTSHTSFLGLNPLLMASESAAPKL